MHLFITLTQLFIYLSIESKAINRMIIRFILCLLSLKTSLSIKYTVPSRSPICNGIKNSGPGGQFGYSVDMSDGEGKHTYLAVGQPWDSSVHIYKTLNPNYSSLNNISTLVEPTWEPVQLIGDTGNGTYPIRAYSLFGYSVSLSEDASWLAVGIPGRSYVPLSKYRQLESHSYSGAVRIYKRNSSDLFNFIGEIVNPNPGTRMWQKFGAKVKWKKTLNNKSYVFISAPGMNL